MTVIPITRTDAPADPAPNAEDYAQACELVDAIGPVGHRETAIAVAAVKLAERRMTGQIEGMRSAIRTVSGGAPQ